MNDNRDPTLIATENQRNRAMSLVAVMEGRVNEVLRAMQHLQGQYLAVCKENAEFRKQLGLPIPEPTEDQMKKMFQAPPAAPVRPEPKVQQKRKKK